MAAEEARRAAIYYCTYQARVDIYWRYLPAADERAHVDAIVTSLMTALDSPTRRWNPYNSAMVKAEFRKRLERASRGQLQPVDELKSLRGGRGFLYEIRWNDINVVDVYSDQKQVHSKTNARLIHAEPNELGIAMLGLVVHEKRRGGTKRDQDDAIDEAERIFNAGLPTVWGVTKRSQRTT